MEAEGKGHETLLGAVVKIPLEPPARRVARLDDARARRAQLLDLRAQLGLEPLILERQRGDGAGGTDLLGGVEQGGIVDDRRDTGHWRAEPLSSIVLDR